MKKLLLLVTSAALFVACSEKVSLNETNEVPIDFTKSYVEKGSKAIHTGLYTTDNLEQAGNTMGVFGWKKKSTTYTQVFNNQEVEFGNSSLAANDWGYTPKRYWDTDADNYAFYAYAPHSSDFPNGGTVALTTASDETTFSITNFTQSTTVASQVDLLVDLSSQKANTTNKAATKSDVAFTFSHILTKLTVKVKTISDFDHEGTEKPQLKLTGLKIKLNGMAQNYAQKTAGTVDAGATDKDAWTNAISTAVEKVCFNADGTTVTDLLLNSSTAQEVASYFVAPTTTGTTGDNATAAGTATVTVTANYDIYYSDGITDHCETPETTVTNLTSFVQNTHNILTVTISPTAILFDVQTVNGFNPENNINQDVD